MNMVGRFFSWFAFLGSVFAAICLAGCAGTNVQIWANSDSNNVKNYTMRNPHYVHVGETVDFHVLVSTMKASYVVLKCDGEYFLLPSVVDRDYTFSKTFDESWRGQTCQMEFRAYKTEGQPDYYESNGRVLKREDEAEPVDLEVGFGVMRVICYQSAIRIRVITRENKEPDWTKGDLMISADDQVTHVGLGKVGEDGFSAIGGDGHRTWIIFYEPKADQLSRSGRSRVTFTVPDPSTQKTIKEEFWIDTP